MLKQLLVGLVIAGVIEGASIEKAKMFNIHGLKDEAKQELIDVIYGTSGADAKADAYYYLGNIALTERKVAVAISTWNELVKKYPNSKRVVEVQQQIEGLKAGLDDTLAVVLENVTANLYLRYAKYWLIDYSPPPITTFGLSDEIQEEAGLKWLDKIIAEFPGTAEAEQAYKHKLSVLLKKAQNKAKPFVSRWVAIRMLGKEQDDQMNNSVLEAIRASDELQNVMSKLIALFDEFEAAFPKSTSLQRFRFGIAQFYTDTKDFEAADQWLNTIIKVAGVGDSFYKQLAQYRLKIR